jgi:hypothetical protein
MRIYIKSKKLLIQFVIKRDISRYMYSFNESFFKMITIEKISVNKSDKLNKYFSTIININALLSLNILRE